MLKAGQDLKFERESGLLMELCDVAAIALADSKYVEELRRVFLRRATRAPAPKPKDAAMDAADPNTAKLVMSMFGGIGRRHA